MLNWHKNETPSVAGQLLIPEDWQKLASYPKKQENDPMWFLLLFDLATLQ
jgi:hypothetical protein